MGGNRNGVVSHQFHAKEARFFKQWHGNDKVAGALKKRDRNGAPVPVVIHGAEGLQAEMRREPAGHVKVVIMKAAGKDEEPHQLTWQEALRGLSAKSPSFRELLSKTVQQLPFEACFWECPPVSFATRGTRLFEFVALDSPRLAVIEADMEPFAKHLYPYVGKPVSKAFLNLGRDAVLVTPAPVLKDEQVYAHIANFFRYAPPEQLDKQWLTLGKALKERLTEVGSQTNVWVCTEGTGVHWLHMRLDSRPKYYHYRAYQDPDYGLDSDSDSDSSDSSDSSE